MKKAVLDINALERFILKIEMEVLLHDDLMQNLASKFKKIKDKYKHAIEIERILLELSQVEDEVAFNEIYNEFSTKRIEGTALCFGDVFSIVNYNVGTRDITYSIKNHKINAEIFNPEIGRAELYKVANAIKGVGEKVVVNSIQAFETCFEELLDYLVKTHPDTYLHDKQIKFADIVKSNIEEITASVIQEKVDSLMYAVNKTISQINVTHKLGLERHQSIWDDYVEMDLHRDIIVHNNGIVNAEYKEKVPKKYKDIEVGEYLRCDATCIKGKTDNLIKFAFLLFYLVGEGNDQLQHLDNIAFTLLKKRNWNVAEYAYSLLLKIPSLEHYDKMMYILNMLNAKKHRLGLEATREEILKIDTTGMEKNFVVAKKMLLEDYDSIEEDLEECYPKHFNTSAIYSWPIFIDFRKTEHYSKFIDLHSEDFECYNYRPELS